MILNQDLVEIDIFDIKGFAMRSKLTDEILWEALRQNDENAFAILFDRYWSLLFTTVFHYIRDKDACSEIVHDIFLNLWKGRDRLEIRSLRKYLTAAARYHTYRHLRNSAARPLEYTSDWEALGRRTIMNTGEEKIRSLELKGIINLHLQQLPKRCREIFILSRVENLSNDEIATRLQISKRTVENQITSALRYFRVAWKDLFVIIMLINL